jgi:hypothetical protein
MDNAEKEKRQHRVHKKKKFLYPLPNMVLPLDTMESSVWTGAGTEREFEFYHVLSVLKSDLVCMMRFFHHMRS